MKVIEINNPTDDVKYYIVNDSQIELKNYCQMPNGFGGEIGCDDAGCDGDEHVQAAAIEYWDGHNWKSFVVEITGNAEMEEFANGSVLGDEEETAKNILAQFKTADFGEYKNGVSVAETDDFIFYMTQYARDFSVAMVEPK